MKQPYDVEAKARLLVRDIQRALRDCNVELAERLVREALEQVREAGESRGLNKGLFKAARYQVEREALVEAQGRKPKRPRSASVRKRKREQQDYDWNYGY